MKLTPIEKARINTAALHNAYRDNLITYQEFSFYILLRDSAYPNKEKGERGMSVAQVHTIVKDHGYPKKRVEIVLNSLERKGFIQSHYFVQTSEGVASYTDIKMFDGENGIGRKRIKYRKFSMPFIPGEKVLRKKAKQKKLNKHG